MKYQNVIVAVLIVCVLVIVFMPNTAAMVKNKVMSLVGSKAGYGALDQTATMGGVSDQLGLALGNSVPQSCKTGGTWMIAGGGDSKEQLTQMKARRQKNRATGYSSIDKHLENIAHGN